MKIFVSIQLSGIGNLAKIAKTPLTVKKQNRLAGSLQRAAILPAVSSTARNVLLRA